MVALVLSGCATVKEEPVVARARALMGATRSGAGDLWLRCVPADADVYLDGAVQGQCADFDGRERGLTVGAGMHRVEVKKQGFWPYLTYYAPNGARAGLTVRLEPTERREGVAP